MPKHGRRPCRVKGGNLAPDDGKPQAQKERGKTMRKAEQIEMNKDVKMVKELFELELRKNGNNLLWHKLRSCSAEVAETETYYVLKSYNTIIAVIIKKTDKLIDWLRLVYGYTATSAQHIAKFEKDYCGGKWGCEGGRYTYREC